jgi:hypothetical protein
MDDRVRYGIIVVVTMVWVANFVAKFVVEGYEPSVGVDGVFGIIAGYLFLSADRARRGGGDSDER